MTTLMRVATETEVTNDFGSAMPATVEAVDPHVTIGVEPDDLAIGIDPVKFLELIGTWVSIMLRYMLRYNIISERRKKKMQR